MIKNDIGVFMDRDGLINVPPPPEDRYILHPDAFQLMPGIAEAIRCLNERKVPVAVVTNQKGVAIGKVDETTLQKIHQRMQELLARENATVQNIQYCPHSEEDHCTCRKPLPGMLHAAASALNLQTKNCWMIGDQPRDLEAGRAAGCHTLLVGSASVPDSLADAHLHHTSNLPEWIKQNFPFQAER